MVAYATMIAGCSSKWWTKSEGSSPVKMVARPGDLPPLAIDPRISDSTPAQPAKAPAAPSKKISESIKHKGYNVVKNARENLSLVFTAEFDFAKFFIREKYNDDLKKVADSMKENPNVKAIIKGHTDSIGSKSYNMRLSKARANSVKRYLISKFGIKGCRITTIGYGFSKPVATNDTEEGRQQNRRAEIFIKGIEAK